MLIATIQSAFYLANVIRREKGVAKGNWPKDDLD